MKFNNLVLVEKNWFDSFFSTFAPCWKKICSAQNWNESFVKIISTDEIFTLSNLCSLVFSLIQSCASLPYSDLKTITTKKIYTNQMKHIVTLLYSVQCECVCFSESDFDSCFYFYCFFILWTVPRICACVCVFAIGLNNVNFLLCERWTVHLCWGAFAVVFVHCVVWYVNVSLVFVLFHWISTLLRKFCFTSRFVSFRLSVRHYFWGSSLYSLNQTEQGARCAP